MPYSKQIYLTAIILYTIIGSIVSHFTDISFIDVFIGFMVCGIFYQILDWKYGIEEGDTNV